jgi:AAA domain
VSLRQKLLNVPACIRDRECWVVTRLTLREGKDAADPKNWTKPPYRVDGSQDGFDGWNPKPADLATLDAALAALDNPKFQPPFEIVGANFTNTPFLCADLDHCFTEKDGDDLKPWARDYVDAWREWAIYAERSPSGDGLHLWFDLRGVAKNPQHTKTEKKFDGGKIELFARNYVTVTGDAWGDCGGAALTKEDYARWWNWFSQRNQADPEPKLSEEKFSLLLAGKLAEAGFTDRSAADQSLCSHLAKKGLPRAEVRQIWLSSGLAREKHERTDYVERTLDKAFEGVKTKAAPRKFFLQFRKLSEEKFEAPVWLVKNILLASAVNLYVGDPDVGKSLRATYDVSGLTRSGKKVAVLCREDSLNSVQLPRMIAAGAQLDLVIPVKGIGVEDSDEQIPWMLDDAVHLDLLKQMLQAEKPALLIIDPLADYAGRLNLNDPGDVRKIFTALNAIAQETGAAILLICHTTKAIVAEGIKMAAGSFQLMASVQVSWLFMKDPDKKDQKLMLPGRNKQGKKKSGCTYTIESYPWPVSCPVNPEDAEDGVGVFVPGRGDPRTADEILSQKTDPEHSKISEVRVWLHGLLDSGNPVATNLCNREAQTRGFDRGAVDKACRQLGVKRDGKTWVLGKNMFEQKGEQS